jgi:ribosomal protein S18 acetylase RimI-like enzyme
MNNRRNDHSAWASARRIEERALNASGAFQSLVYDGWLLGYRPGPTKRLRCINPFYPSTLPLAEKIDYCAAFYAAAGLPAVFRLLPFSEPSGLDGWLDDNAWGMFERTLVLRADLAPAPEPAGAGDSVDIVGVAQWEPLVAELLDIAPIARSGFAERAAMYPLPQAGAVIRRNGEIVACGLLKLEDDHAGLFALKTAPSWRGQGLGRAVVAALLDEARRHGAATAYLQVTADNAPALALYRRFGFAAAYEYWYRAREGEQR